MSNRLGVVLRCSFKVESLFHLIRLDIAQHCPLHRAEQDLTATSVLEVETTHLGSETRIIVLVNTLGSWRFLLVRCVAFRAVLLSFEHFGAN